jgi:hypothetical protein
VVVGKNVRITERFFDNHYIIQLPQQLGSFSIILLTGHPFLLEGNEKSPTVQLAKFHPKPFFHIMMHSL